MMSVQGAFAKVGRSFAIDEGDRLYQAVRAARAACVLFRAQAREQAPRRRWRGPGIEIDIPIRLAQ